MTPQDAALQDLLQQLRESLRTGYLFQQRDEPLDAYGRRIVRVIELRLTTVLHTP